MLWIGCHIEHVAIENREFPFELADHVLGAGGKKNEVGAEDTEQRSEEAAQQGQDHGVFLREKQQPAVGGPDVPALANRVKQPVLAQLCQRSAARIAHRVRSRDWLEL